ncbi:Rv3212 family protein [Corynebacterium terpenotabidum]|uniref:Uncharacterized protein n=1 Tax=Corynebacterium terpenotabidum Y-11 TaxID=1200352 RepID=S4XI52_9CORY|nr:hypothetical protein [Corynebacterium terpenotabidum]AGP31370.1 hypothetical protein A606_08635 [Corynebacterium terpenotabidum Y-11]
MNRRDRPERRTRTDLIVTAGLTAAALCVAGGTWLYSDARGTDHTVASAGDAIAPTNSDEVGVPTGVTETWTTTTDPAITPEPLTMDGAVIRSDAHGITALDASDGHEVWTYHRDLDLCGLTGSWSRVVAVYDGPKGCGDATSFAVSTGRYVDTRSALAADTVTTFRSLDHVGLLSTDRVELWRSDLVRTVEIGQSEIPALVDAQPTADCSYSSALTRKQVLAVAMDCPGAEDGDRTVILFNADPEDASEPEVDHEFAVPSGSELVAVGQDAALIYVPGNGERAEDADDEEGSRFQVLRTDGTFEQYPADPSSLLPRASDVDLFIPQTADLPHHMTWFDGEQVVAFGPTDLDPRFSVPALGTGAAMGGRLLLPVDGGIAVVDWSDGHIENVLPVDRGDWTGPVTLRVQGTTVIEQRGADLVGLTAQFA